LGIWRFFRTLKEWEAFFTNRKKMDLDDMNDLILMPFP
jgi:hypothetical protein